MLYYDVVNCPIYHGTLNDKSLPSIRLPICFKHVNFDDSNFDKFVKDGKPVEIEPNSPEGVSYRSRLEFIKNFQKRLPVMTNLFGRGTNIERVNVEFNYDKPEDSDTYLIHSCWSCITSLLMSPNGGTRSRRSCFHYRWHAETAISNSMASQQYGIAFGWSRGLWKPHMEKNLLCLRGHRCSQSGDDRNG